MVGTCLPFIRSCRNNFARHSEKSKKRKTEKRWEDIIRERTGLELAKFQRAVENRQKWMKLVVKSSLVPQQLAVKGLMIMLMMIVGSY